MCLAIRRIWGVGRYSLDTVVVSNHFQYIAERDGTQVKLLCVL